MGLYAKSDDDILKQVHEWLEDAKDKSREWRKEAQRCYDFYAGHQYSPEDLDYLDDQERAAVTFNRLGAIVDAVCGHQINNKSEIRYIPREIGDAAPNEILTGAARWVEDEADTDDEDEEIFHDLVITGMGWSEVRMDYEEELDGQLIPGQRFSPFEAYWDHRASRRNIADSKWRARGRWIDRDDANTKWPELGDVDWSDDRWVYAPQEDPHDASKTDYEESGDSRTQWYNKSKDEVFVLHVEWWEMVPVHRVVDPTSGQVIELSEKKFSKLKEGIEAAGIQHVRQQKRKFYRAFICGPKVLEKSENAWPDGFTLMCVTGKRDTNKNSWFGIVRPLIEPQEWSNKFLSDLQDMIVSNRLGGAFVETSALADPRGAEENWNRPNPLIMVNDGALGRGAIQERSPPPLPPALDRMIEWCISAIPAVSGINQEFMGYADRDQPNVLEIQRKRSAINVLATMFSSLRKYRKDRARAMLHFIQTFMNDGRLIRVAGGDGMERYIPLALDRGTAKFDMVIDESSAAPNQKEETFSVLLALLPYMVQGGIAPPIELLEYLPLPSSFVAKWREQLTKKEPSPQDQIVQQASMVEIQKTAAEAQVAQAKARREAAEAEAQEIENMAVKMGLVSLEDL